MAYLWSPITSTKYLNPYNYLSNTTSTRTTFDNLFNSTSLFVTTTDENYIDTFYSIGGISTAKSTSTTLHIILVGYLSTLIRICALQIMEIAEFKNLAFFLIHILKFISNIIPTDSVHTPSTATCNITVTTTTVIVNCQSYKASWNKHCYYLDGTVGNCITGSSKAKNAVLKCINSLFAGKPYRSTISNNCCV
ncbi:hypothetical protein I4U23_004390 [Adineta vaga]|nr:hypothetical protein I4U23_004390 [Adineta vaga]